MSLIERQKAARDFAERWKGRGYEKGESQSFWLSLLSEVLGVGHPTEWISFEQQVHLDHTSFIDAYIPRTHVMIEQKSIEKDLGAPVRQSDGSLLNPFQQAKRYAAGTAQSPPGQRPRGDGGVWFLPEDDRKRVCGGAVQDVSTAIIQYWLITINKRKTENGKANRHRAETATL